MEEATKKKMFAMSCNEISKSLKDLNKGDEIMCNQKISDYGQKIPQGKLYFDSQHEEDKDCCYITPNFSKFFKVKINKVWK